MSDEKSVEAAIMDGDIGPHTCRSCCAPTWNDWEVCDECENEASDLSDAAELARLRAEVERLTAALSDERAHADALLADARQRLAYDAETFHDQGAWDREDACLAIVKRIDLHRARRQG